MLFTYNTTKNIGNVVKILEKMKKIFARNTKLKLYLIFIYFIVYLICFEYFVDIFKENNLTQRFY